MSALFDLRRTALAALVVGAFALLCAGRASAEVTYLESFGTSGSGAGQLLGPTSVAVNETTGDIYVADIGNQRVDQFDEHGNFIRAWGRQVDASTNGSVCTSLSGDVCAQGLKGGQAGQFISPVGVAVDNSNGSAAGSVYVEDTGNTRIQRFTADGQFVLAWGKQVDQQNGGNLCSAASGHTCQAGTPSGVPASFEPPIAAVPSEDGVFAPWRFQQGFLQDRPGIAVDGQGFVYVTEPHAVPRARAQKFTPEGQYVGKLNPNDPLLAGEAVEARSPAIDSAGGFHLVAYGGVGGFASVWSFLPGDFSIGGAAASPQEVHGQGRYLEGLAIDPSNQFQFVTAGKCPAKPGTEGMHIVEFSPSGQEVDCTVFATPEPGSFGGGPLSGLTVTSAHRLLLASAEEDRIRIYRTPVAEAPHVASEKVSEVGALGVRINATISGNLATTTFHVEYGPAPCSANPCASSPESDSIGAAVAALPATQLLSGLSPDTTYHYRVVAANGVGSDTGPERTFTTYSLPTLSPCENNLARQQTGAASLLDCRAYELVSARDQGGYDVESDLVPGQTPYPGYPQAVGRALYAVHNGGIPGSGRPTNRGLDPYVATRNADRRRWETSYVGIPANAPSLEPFSSTLAGADARLSTFAFGGPEICNPCFGDATSGIPLRRPDGTLAQGMKGPLPVGDPQSAGEIRKPVSADGTHLVFGSLQAFVAGANENGTDLNIYDRNLTTGATRLVSTTPGAAPFTVGEGIAELDVSSNGSRILLGERVGADPGGNPLWRLYMHVGGAPNTIELTPGSTSGAHYAGMNADGTRVYFSTSDPLATESEQDTDASVDIFRADVGTLTATLTRVSSGGGAGDTDGCNPAANSARQHWNTLAGIANCDAVPVGGSGGVSAGDGSIYFLSPEQLDSGSVQDAPNLYLARPGSSPEFVATLESSLNAPLSPERHLFERSFGSFSYPEGVAIDRPTGSVYVLDTVASTSNSAGAYVQKFDSSGTPDLTFGSNSKLSSTPLDGALLESGSTTPTGLAAQIAVDNSGGVANRDLYVPAVGNKAVYKISPSGNYLDQLKLGLGDLPGAVGVNQSNGHVVGLGFASAYTYDASGNTISPGSFNVSTFGARPLGVAVDSAGNFYVANGKETRLYSPAGNFIEVFDAKPSFGIAIDPSDGHIYVNRGDRVVEYDSGGTVLDPNLGLGLLEGSVSLAADGGRLVVSNPGRNRVASFSPPRVPPSSAYDNPLVLDSVGSPEERHPADFQLTPDGAYAAFPSALPLTGIDSAGHYQAFRWSTAAQSIACVSCVSTEAEPTSDASLASRGLSITDDGRVFFTTGDPLVLRDGNSQRDAYEWESGTVELISTGHSSFDSSLFSVTADGTDAFFFTHETLESGDANGNLVKLYDARQSGGFFEIPPPPPCAASDECHGPSSEAPAPLAIGTGSGVGGNEASQARKTCRKPRVRRNGRCVKPSHKKTKRRRGR